MRGLLPALVLLATAIACSGDDSPTGTPSDDPKELARQVAQAWTNVDTFHASWDSPDSSSDPPTEADFVSPERISLHQDSAERLDKYTYDAIFTKRGFLSRTCEEDDCSNWAFFPWDYYGGGTTLLSLGQELPLRILGHIFADLHDPSIVSGDDDGLVHLAAEFNVARAVLDSTIENVETFGLDFGNSCESQFAESSIEIGQLSATITLTPTPSPTPDCEDFTADDLRESNGPAVDHYEDSPQPIDIWISTDTLLPERVRFNLPGNIPVSAGQPAGPFIDDSGRDFDIHFSHYGDVTVDIPAIQID